MPPNAPDATIGSLDETQNEHDTGKLWSFLCPRTGAGMSWPSNSPSHRAATSLLFDMETSKTLQTNFTRFVQKGLAMSGG